MRLNSFLRFCIFVLAIRCGWLQAAEPVRQQLFTAGEADYALYRIPGLVTTKNQTVLVVAEARKRTSDWGQIDLVLRRSPDAGKTWEPQRLLPAPQVKLERNPVAVAKKLGREGELCFNNPVLIADHEAGVVHLLICVEYARCFYARSTDDGKTFSDWQEITATFAKFRPEYEWQVIATGPGHGIQLRTGRLVVPVWLSPGTGAGAHHPSAVSTIFSDDGGKTWLRGELIAQDQPSLRDPNESCLVELNSGGVLINMRNPSTEHRRALSRSTDGATKWSPPQFHEQLIEPVCMASMVRYDQQTILFANPATTRERKNLTIRLSRDDGATWSTGQLLDGGPSAYSDLAVLDDGTILCLYEQAGKHLTLARFSLEWVEGK